MLNYINRGSHLVTKAFTPISKVCLGHQIRNTFVLKRRKPPILHKIGAPPRRLRPRHYIYDFVEDTDTSKQENLELILLDYVEGIGLKGDVVSVRPNFGRYQLLLPKLAVYSTPENLLKYQKSPEDADVSQSSHSSLYAGLTMKFLSRCVIAVVMNMDHPWTIEPWHIRASLRKAGIFAPEYAITLPRKPISGPNMDLEGKTFMVTVKINGLETAIVRCKIHHWTSDASRRLPSVPIYWCTPTEPVFEEDVEQLKSLPLPPEPKQAKNLNVK